MRPRIVYVHGNGTSHWSFGWAAWLKEQLGARGFPTFFETMPDSVIARRQYWMPFLEQHVGLGEDDVVVGWSSGAVAAMRYAEVHRIAGSVLVGPSYTDLDDELERQSGWFDSPWDWPAIRRNQGAIFVVSSDSDPYIPSDEFRTIVDELEAEHLNLPGRGHFMEEDTFPELLDLLVDRFG